MNKRKKYRNLQHENYLMSVIIKDHQDLEDVETIAKIQEPLLRALRIYSRNRRPKGPVIYPKLLMKLYDLRNISMRGSLKNLYLLNFSIYYITIS